LSPILVRPVREQLEHDRVIRLLQADLAKKKVEVGINPGAEQNAAVGGGSRREFPDAVLYSTEKGKKLIAVVEVETAESVNHLEAMSQWAHLARLKVPFHLYVPTASVDVARRLSQDHAISVTEIWSYHQVGEQFRFTLIYPPPRGRSAGAPRTVSVASIRVEPRVDPTADAPDRAEPAPGAPSAAAASVRAKVPAQPRVIPAKTARAAQPVKPAAVKAAAPAARVPKEVAVAKVPAKRNGGEPKASTAKADKPATAKAAPAVKPATAKATPAVKPANVVTRPGRALSAASSRPSSRASAPARPAVPPRKTSASVRPKASPTRAKAGRGAPRPAPSRKSSSKRR
jgi:hypothetical protein